MPNATLTAVPSTGQKRIIKDMRNFGCEEGQTDVGGGVYVSKRDDPYLRLKKMQEIKEILRRICLMKRQYWKVLNIKIVHPFSHIFKMLLMTLDKKKLKVK